MLTFPLI